MATNFASLNSLLPGRNTGGTSLPAVPDIAPMTGSTSGANPILSPTNLPAGAPQSNPYGTTNVPNTPAVPTLGIDSGPYSSSGGTVIGSSGTGNTSTDFTPSGFLAGMSQSELKSMLAELSKTYGSGIAGALMNFLNGGAGYSQQALNNVLAGLQPQINQGTQSLLEEFSAGGDRFGSDAQLGLSNFLSQVNLNEGEISTQMYENSLNNFMSILTGTAGQTASRIANTPSTLDTIGSALSLGSDVAGGLSQLGVGGPLGSIISAVSAL
jgi:hypothetical protein